MSGKFSVEKGDWACGNKKCNNINFSKREKCNKCGESKPAGRSSEKVGHEIGKAAAEKSNGLFSAEDWQCKSCGNVNWARRSTCNVCNAPRVNIQGQRTGYGGGYMERDEVVEYKARADSDDEYDEFGRKKKQFRAKIGAGVPPKENSSKPTVDDEEEDEDDDDGDLSKYDIWGDEDSKDGTKSGEKTKARAGSPDGMSSSSGSGSGSSYSSSGSSDTESSSSSRSSRSTSRSKGANDVPEKRRSHSPPRHSRGAETKSHEEKNSRSRSRSPVMRYPRG